MIALVGEPSQVWRQPLDRSRSRFCWCTFFRWRPFPGFGSKRNRAARLTHTRCPRDSSSRRTGDVLGLVTEPASASRDGAWWHGGIGLPAV